MHTCTLYIHIHIHSHAHMLVHIYTYMHKHKFTHNYIEIHVHMLVLMYACMHACTHPHLCTHCTHTHPHARVHTYTHTHIAHTQTTLVEEAKLKDLQRELKGVVTWFQLGLELDIPDDELLIIREDIRGVEKCLLEVLIHWGDREKCTWTKVVGALVKIGRYVLAEGIAKKYGKNIKFYMYRYNLACVNVCSIMRCVYFCQESNYEKCQPSLQNQ